MDNAPPVQKKTADNLVFLFWPEEGNSLCHTSKKKDIMMTNHITQPLVLDSQKVSGWHVAMIVIGVAITLPAFLIGSEIMGALGARQGSFAILTGGVILAVIASACMYIAVCKRQTTYQLLNASFGSLGSRGVSFLISVTLLGWFGVTVSLFGQAAARSMEELFSVQLPFEFYVMAGCLVMTGTTIYGFHAIDILSKFTVPFMLLILVAGVYFVSSNFSWAQIWTTPATGAGGIATFGGAVSVVVGSFMVGMTILPDISRFINRKEQVYVASLGSFGSVFAFILIMAGLPVLMTGEKSLINAMYQSGLGVPALVMMIFASWTTNVSNLYSSSLGLAQVFPKIRGERITVMAGLLGGMMAVSGIMDYLIGFLVLLGIFIPPVAGIYIAHFFWRCRECTTAISGSAFLSWGLASGLALMTSSNVFTLTTVPALDSFLTATLCYGVISKACVLWPRSQPSDGC